MSANLLSVNLKGKSRELKCSINSRLSWVWCGSYREELTEDSLEPIKTKLIKMTRVRICLESSSSDGRKQCRETLLRCGSRLASRREIMNMEEAMDIVEQEKLPEIDAWVVLCTSVRRYSNVSPEVGSSSERNVGK